MSARIVICGAQVPFVRGGAETLYESLRDELRRRGHDVEIVTLPFNWRTRTTTLKSAFAWRLVDLDEVAGTPVDLVIATRFPTYLVRHPNKVVWLIHQYRQAYDLLGTPYSDFSDSPDDLRMLEMIRAMDRRALGEAQGLFSISANTAERLERHNGLVATPLHPPLKLGDRYRCGSAGDYVFAVGRLDPMKRFDLLVRALACTDTPVRAVVAGEGPELETLRALAAELGVADRFELPGRIDDEELLDRYAGALAVFYAPFDEDYGYVTVEAFRSGRPMLTTADAGGILEFVVDGENGYVTSSADPSALGERIDRLFRDRALARRLGESGRRRVADVTWDRVVEQLTATL
ncbi:MAG: glycosyltransferase family 4 protein [Holophagales bacterium]|nr:MAG: glycosyltransferase family 4 protein [Holophagales bacterium]